MMFPLETVTPSPRVGLKIWSGAAIVAGTLVLQLAGIWLLLSSRGQLGSRGTGLLVVLGTTVILTAALCVRKRPVNRSAPGDARLADDCLRLAMESDSGRSNYPASNSWCPSGSLCRWFRVLFRYPPV